MKNNLFILILITLLISISAGSLAALFISNQSLSPYNYLGFGQELNLNDYSYLSPSLIIQDPKKVIVNQDVKIDEAITSLASSVMGVYLKNIATSSSYYLPEPFAQALVVTTDGWVMVAWPVEISSLEAEQFINDYVLIDSNKRLYTIEQTKISPVAAGRFVFFKLNNANSLNIRRLVSDSEIKVGQSVMFINGYGSASLNIISSKKLTGQIISSDEYPFDLEFSGDKVSGPKFVFNLSGDIIGILDAQDKWLSSSDIEAYWRSLFKTNKVEKAAIGINYLDLSQVLAVGQLEKGALLKASSSTPAVIPNSAAAIAGLKAGDIITKINGQELNETHNLSLLISGYNVGDSIIVTYLRQETEQQVSLILKALN